MTLRLSPERIREELFSGGFLPMGEIDFYGYADAEPGSLIARINIGRFGYDVIFTPSLGNVQIFDHDLNNHIAWEMDLNTGKVIEL